MHRQNIGSCLEKYLFRNTETVRHADFILYISNNLSTFTKNMLSTLFFFHSNMMILTRKKRSLIIIILNFGNRRLFPCLYSSSKHCGGEGGGAGKIRDSYNFRSPPSL